jgi:ribosomal protein S18 acetylase RimI-like enzyme
MPVETELHYICKPTTIRQTARVIEFLTVQEFLADEPACQRLWELVGTQFRTRGKFLAVWSGVRYVAVHRDMDGRVDGFLLVNAPINWQIDYVVVSPESHRQGIASALVTEVVNQAFMRGVPYVMLTSKESLRPLYEGCGFIPVLESPAHAFWANQSQDSLHSASHHTPSLPR